MNLNDIIIEQVNLYNQGLDEQVDLSKGEDSVLFGRESVLDSADFVSLIIDIEEAVEDATGKSITLADERAMSQKNSPFRTIKSLRKYIEGLLGENNE